MSLLDTASLIVTPNGYKEGKLYSVIPSDGSGDLSVTRATTATRVNSAGLVELVPYNLFSYSEQFDNAYYTKISGSITANSTTAPNGTTTADSFIEDTSNDAHYIDVRPTVVNSNHTVSIYVKANGRTKFQLREGSNGDLATFDLSSPSGNITNVGNGWFRVFLTTTPAATTFIFQLRLLDNSGNLVYTGNGTSGLYIWGAQLVEGSTAKDYQKTETRLNIPRLDYSNGTCPSLLVEPQRTNRLIYSEQLIQGRAWAFTSGTFTVTENTTETLDPFGNNNADKFNATTQSNNDSYTSTSGSGNLTISIFAKKGTNDSIQLYHDNVLSGGAFSATFNLTSGTITASSGTASIQDLGNGWYRCSVSGTDSNSSGNIHGVTTYTGTTYLFGVQLEQGSYATSYIPTTSASVTRNADVILKTGISSLIGQTEGTLFVDFICNGFTDFGTPLCINDGSTANSIWITTFGNGDIRGEVFGSSNVQATFTYSGGVVGQRYKLALVYKANDFAMYVNGTLVGSDSSGTLPINLSRVDFDYANASLFVKSALEIKAAALWKTRLTNTQLAQLTTI